MEIGQQVVPFLLLVAGIPDAQGSSGQEAYEATSEVAMKVQRYGELFVPENCPICQDRPCDPQPAPKPSTFAIHFFPGQGQNAIKVRVMLQYLGPAIVTRPPYRDIRRHTPNSANRRQCSEDIAHGAQPDHKNPEPAAAGAKLLQDLF